jgi:hypothetical protein
VTALATAFKRGALPSLTSLHLLGGAEDLFEESCDTRTNLPPFANESFPFADESLVPQMRRRDCVGHGVQAGCPPLPDVTAPMGAENLSDESCDTRPNLLRLPTNLPFLPLHRCGGVTALATAFKRGALPSLTSLHLEANGIEAEGASQLGRALGAGGCQSLRELRLAFNKVGGGGARQLAEAFKAGTIALQRLDLRHNHLHAQDALRALVEASRAASCRLEVSDVRW